MDNFAALKLKKVKSVIIKIYGIFEVHLKITTEEERLKIPLYFSLCVYVYFIFTEMDVIGASAMLLP